MERAGIAQRGTAVDHIERPHDVRIGHVVWVVDDLADGGCVVGDRLGARVGDVQRLEIGREGNSVGLLKALVHDPHGASFGVEAVDGRCEDGVVWAYAVAEGVVCRIAGCLVNRALSIVFHAVKLAYRRL